MGAECSGSGKAEIGALYCVGRCPTTDVKTGEIFSDNLSVTVKPDAGAFTGEYIEQPTGNSSAGPVTSSVPRCVTNALFMLTFSVATYLLIGAARDERSL